MRRFDFLNAGNISQLFSSHCVLKWLEDFESDSALFSVSIETDFEVRCWVLAYQCVGRAYVGIVALELVVFFYSAREYLVLWGFFDSLVHNFTRFFFFTHDASIT